MNVSNALQAGLAALRTGDYDLAELHLLAVLKHAPNEADALQLMGMIRKGQDRLVEAKSFLRMSIAARPNQPHVLNNLANLANLTVDQERNEAVELFHQAILLKPNYPDAIANLAGILQLQNQLPQAKELFLQAVKLDANHVQSLLGLTSLCWIDQQLEEGLGWVNKALAIAPTSMRAHHLHGHIRADRHEYDQAVLAFKEALAIGPASDELWTALGSALRYGLRDQEAFEAFGNALKLNPANLVAHQNINSLLWNYGRHDRYLDSYRTMLPLVPDDGPIRIAFADELLRHGDIDEARIVIEQARKSGGSALSFTQLRGRLAYASGDFGMAADLFDQAISEAPQLSGPYIRKIDGLLKAGKFEAAFDFSALTLPKFPLDQDILARLVAAERLNGRESGLWDIDQFVRAIDLVPPDGRTVEDFNRELGEYLATLHTAISHPIDQTLRGGTQTFGHILASDKTPIIQSLVAMLRAAIADYIEQLPAIIDHPVSSRRSSGFDFSGSWSARLLANGFHTNHIHPKGWLSSAYYVDLPRACEDTTAKAGWFKLGQTHLELGPQDQPQHLIEPRVGRLILFPSYYWHGTTAFNDSAQRLTVAFDVVPT